MRDSPPTPQRRPIPAAEGPVVDPASFRDPSGFVFRRDGVLYRQVQPSAAADWEALRSTGLLARLVADRLLIDHEEMPLADAASPGAVAVIRPRLLDFISYPYEWSFSQLKEAALLTLEIQSKALDAGMRLKDASAYNVQLDGGRPILIDSLSFEVAPSTEPWPAYRQFCEHFLAPLALIAYRDARTGLMLRDFIDGLPLDLATGLLPGRTRLNFGLASHLHAHAGAQRRAASAAPATEADHKPPRRISETGQRALLDSLRRTVEGLRWTPSGHWSEYATTTSYSDEGTASKAALVREMLDAVGGRSVWDLGANTGVYSALAAEAGYRVIAWDFDAGSVEAHWRRVRGADGPPHPAAHRRPVQPVPGHRLGARGARLVPGSRECRCAAGAGARPSPRDRQQRAATRGRVALRTDRAERHRRVRPEGGPDDAQAPGSAAGHLRQLHD